MENTNIPKIDKDTVAWMAIMQAKIENIQINSAGSGNYGIVQETVEDEQKNEVKKQLIYCGFETKVEAEAIIELILRTREFHKYNKKQTEANPEEICGMEDQPTRTGISTTKNGIEVQTRFVLVSIEEVINAEQMPKLTVGSNKD